jgi:uncharacterized protein
MSKIKATDDHLRYFIFLYEEDGKALTPDVVQKHVAHLRKLDADGRLIICGPFTDFAGGVVVIDAIDIDEAHQIAKSDPFVSEGYRTYKVQTIKWSREESNHLLDEKFEKGDH